MRFLNRFLKRLTNFVTGRRDDQRLREEMEEHLAQQTEDNLRAGMSIAEARRQAVLKFGAAGAIREKYHSEVSLPFLETLMRDLRYAFRQLAASPGFASIAILTIALGIGATTAIYSVVDATLLHPLPYPRAEQLVRIEDNLAGIAAQNVGISIPEWRDLESTGIFQSVSIAGRGASVNLTGSARPLRLSFKQVTPNYFTLLGEDAQLGRTFDPHDATPGYNLEVVISDGLWRREFGADPHIIGRALRLDNDEYHVVGVMSRGFHDQGATTDERNVELWLGAGFSGLPFAPPQRSLRLHSRAVIARLKPGLSVAAAQSRLDAFTASLQRQYPADYPPESAWSIRLIPLSELVVGNVRQPLLLMMGAVGLVLLIGCVNVANLLLARATARGREMAVRQALGAARGQLIRQLLTESLLLSLLGGVAGLAILFGARKLLLELIPASVPRLNDVSINWTVLLFALSISVVAGVCFGLAPALQAARLDPIRVLRQEGRGSKGSKGQTWTLSALVVTEFALSLVLLIAAGLLLRSFWDLFKVQPGFNPDRVMAVQTWLPGPNDPSTDPYGTAAQESVLLREILRRSQSLPGVEEAAVGDKSALPLGHNDGDLEPLLLIREGLETKTNLAPVVGSSTVSPQFFHLLGIPLLRGRLFSDQDLVDTPQVVVINQAAARAYWPSQDPVGKHVRLGESSGRVASDGSTEWSTDPVWTTIVGVIADARTESLAHSGTPEIYRSVYQHPFKDVTIFLRGSLDPAKLPEQALKMVQSIDPELPVFGAQTLPDVVSDSLAQRRFSMDMVLLFALTALLLAGIGVYGTISYIVSERTRDIGIRIALGAQRKTILRMVLSQGLALALVGAAAGLVGALIATHMMAGLLYGVSPSDPLTFISLTLVLVLVALAACYVPARSAMRVDPIVALREA
jgi:putative ABC transport system permease protein